MADPSIASDRTWADAELWARDAFAQWAYECRTFNALTMAEQTAVVHAVHLIAESLRLYLAGDVDLSAWHRTQLQFGAQTVDALASERRS